MARSSTTAEEQEGLFEQGERSERSKEPKRAHHTPEVAIVIEYPRAIIVTKALEKYQFYILHTKSMGQQDFADRVREHAELMLGIWRSDERRKASHENRETQEPVWWPPGSKLYQQALRKLRSTK